jgi:hypothetical protein
VRRRILSANSAPEKPRGPSKIKRN